MGRIGCTGQCGPFGRVFSFLYYIHHSHTVLVHDASDPQQPVPRARRISFEDLGAAASIFVMAKLNGAGDRFGEYLCANFPAQVEATN